MPNIVPTSRNSPPAPVAPGVRPVEPLSAKQVWEVAEEVFTNNDAYPAYSRAKRAYNAQNGCFAIAVEGVRPADTDCIAAQIGKKLETDFSVYAKDGKFLMTINEIQNPNSVEAAALAERIAEYNAQRDKFRYGLCL